MKPQATPNQSILKHIATLGPTGYLPIAPGTWGSGVTVLIWWFFMKDLSLSVHFIIVLAVFLIGIVASNAAEKLMGKDPGQVVIDEVAGQLVTLSLCPNSILWAGASFLAFRLFDILKPPPVDHLESIKGGLGIMIDDIVAGIYGLTLIVAAKFLIN